MLAYAVAIPEHRTEPVLPPQVIPFEVVNGQVQHVYIAKDEIVRPEPAAVAPEKVESPAAAPESASRKKPPRIRL